MLERRRPRPRPPRWPILLWALLVVGLLYLPHTAGAMAPAEGWGAIELRIAQTYWGASPTHCASESIQFGVTQFAVEDGRAGEATLPTGAPTPCVMRIRAGLDIYTQCRVVVHEFGHWLGLGHDDNPHSIMYPTLTTQAVPACRRLEWQARHA